MSTTLALYITLRSLVVSIADERDNQLYALSPDVLTTAIPGMLTLKVC